MMVSALRHEGVKEVWDMLVNYRTAMQKSGEFDDNRRRQSVDWMWALLMGDLKSLFLHHKEVKTAFPHLQEAVSTGVTTPAAASRRLLEIFRKKDI
jgi:LAO/AO transport system kinase